VPIRRYAGLDSALSHNTEASLAWLPNVGLALVAVSVDPLFSQRDIDLLKAFTSTRRRSPCCSPKPILSERELAEVTGTCTHSFPGTPRNASVFPYSTKPGFERFREALEAELAGGTLERFAEERDSILTRKVTRSCRMNDYLR